MVPSKQKINQKNIRKSGILLHPTSLPGPYGIGDIGPEAVNFLHFLNDTGVSLWQILPIHPPGYGNSPYTAYSAFAGNELFISPDVLLEEQFIAPQDLTDYPELSHDTVQFQAVYEHKHKLFQKAYDNFLQQPPKHLISIQSLLEKNQDLKQNTDARTDFHHFSQLDFIQHWLEDYALFRAIKLKHENQSWDQWPLSLRDREPQTLHEFHKQHQRECHYQQFLQYLFLRQWLRLKQKAHELDITIFGDIPIFVSYDSAEVWSHKKNFNLNKDGKPKTIAGVPPDYFSETGQLWGNPLYKWSEMKKNDYLWWEKRLQALSKLVDWIRIDHFRGFQAFWEVPATEKTAINGQWKKGPGSHFFKTLLKKIDIQCIVAEDLGVITQDVEQLRDLFAFPGMKILHFAFGGGADNQYLPHNHIRNCVVYTGTHDNDTTVGWFNNAPEHVKKHVHDYFGIDGTNIAHHFIRYVMMSVADTAIFPIQDLLQLGSQHRMNTPATAEGNWGWRMHWSDITPEKANFISELNRLSNRKPIK